MFVFNQVNKTNKHKLYITIKKLPSKVDVNITKYTGQRIQVNDALEAV